MTAILDLKGPTLVVVGHWNAAILNEPGWIARHILNVPEGETIQLQAVLVGNKLAPGQVSTEKQIWLFEKFGMCCNGQRLEFYSRDIDDVAAVYEAIEAIAEKLLHTPAVAIGVNFNFSIKDDLEGAVPLFETKEDLDDVGAIHSQDRADSLEIPANSLLTLEDGTRPTTALNLTRKTDFATAEISFNYHTVIPGISALIPWASSTPIDHWRLHAFEAMQKIYGIEEFENSYL